ncbi:MAG: 4-hydroxy-tetrahydrodipicolinate synthase [Saprospiraceae bacterium]|nr:4-hydroxy-tetrahydrodipicolinate synthase [Saprospiraceae bacterium]
MKQPNLSGTGVAIVTPFKNGEVDYPALKNIINHVINGGVEFIVSLGTTGEAVNLSADECRKVLDFTIQTVDQRRPIVAGLFGSNYTQKLIDGVQNYNFDGIDAIMSSSPAYIKPSQEGIYQHYMRLAEVAPRPVVIYNVPGRTSSNVEPETVIRLANDAPEVFMAVKEAAGDIVQAMQLIKYRPEGFLVLSGDDPITMPMVAAGADGLISVIANAYPNACSDMVRAALEGDLATARQLNEALLDIHPWLYIEGNPAGIKAALETKGLCSKEVRISLTALSTENHQELNKAMAIADKALQSIKV